MHTEEHDLNTVTAISKTSPLYLSISLYSEIQLKNSQIKHLKDAAKRVRI